MGVGPLILTPIVLIVIAFVAALILLREIRNLNRAIRGFRQVRKRQSGNCPSCGYDLRASTQRCPECGAPIDFEYNWIFRTPKPKSK